MIAFNVYEQSASGSGPIFGRIVTAADLDDAARLAIHTCHDDRFVVAIVQTDCADAFVSALGGVLDADDAECYFTPAP